MRLLGKVAIVTGAGSSGPGVGNGKATAILFAREGAMVLIVDNHLDRATETLRMVESEGGRASVFSADVTKSEDCLAMVNAAVIRFGRLDILHNNVGITGGGGNVVDLDLDQWDTIMSVNLKSMVLTSRYAIPYMVSGGGGSIINVSSIAALRPPNGGAAYAASKGGVLALTRAMAMSHGPDKVRVNCILPGSVFTPLVAKGQTDEVRKQRTLAVPLEVEGTAWDIAWAAVYLASDESRWVTGVALPVDGGLLLTTQLPNSSRQARG